MSAGMPAGGPRPRPVGWFLRFRHAVTGIVDRTRYGAAVSDGAHTHHTRGFEARANVGITAVDRWERAVLHPIELQLAALTPAPPRVERDPLADAPAPADERERVRWAIARRRADEANLVYLGKLDVHLRDEQRRDVLEREHLATRHAAAELRAEWVERYLLEASVYGRWRIGRRGSLRPASESTVPSFTELARVFRSETSIDGVHGSSGQRLDRVG